MQSLAGLLIDQSLIGGVLKQRMPSRADDRSCGSQCARDDQNVTCLGQCAREHSEASTVRTSGRPETSRSSVRRTRVRGQRQFRRFALSAAPKPVEPAPWRIIKERSKAGSRPCPIVPRDSQNEPRGLLRRRGRHAHVPTRLTASTTVARQRGSCRQTGERRPSRALLLESKESARAINVAGGTRGFSRAHENPGRVVATMNSRRAPFELRFADGEEKSRRGRIGPLQIFDGENDQLHARRRRDPGLDARSVDAVAPAVSSQARLSRRWEAGKGNVEQRRDHRSNSASEAERLQRLFQFSQPLRRRARGRSKALPPPLGDRMQRSILQVTLRSCSSRPRCRRIDQPCQAWNSCPSAASFADAGLAELIKHMAGLRPPQARSQPADQASASSSSRPRKAGSAAARTQSFCRLELIAQNARYQRLTGCGAIVPGILIGSVSQNPRQRRTAPQLSAAPGRLAGGSATEPDSRRAASTRRRY